MELNQLLQNLLAQSGIKPDAGSNKILAELTRVTDAQQTQTLLRTLARAINQPINRQTSATLAASSASKPAQLPALVVELTLIPNRQPNQAPQLQVVVRSPMASSPTQSAQSSASNSFTVALTKPQQQAVQALLSTGKSSTPNVMVVQPSPAAAKPATAQASATVVLQFAKLTQPSSSPTQTATPVRVELPLSQLPKPVIASLVNQLSKSQPAGSSAPAPSSASTFTPSAAPLLQSRPIAIKQAQQITPKQLQQALQQLVTAGPRIEAPSNSASPLAAHTVRQPEQAIARVLQAVSQQLPQAEAMQRPEALRQWVNDWFAAKPVTQAANQQLGNLGKMLMMLLGFSLQQPKSAGQSAALNSSQQSSLSQLTQALLDQVLRPAPRLPGEPALTGEVRDRINQLLQQMPQTQLQRLMQLFTSAVSHAQTSQARLADSPANQPEYFILLPTSNQQPAQNELLIRREHERGSNNEEGRTVWLFTLRFELAKYGPLLVKGRYHPAGSRVDFYTESEAAERAMQVELERLEERFEALEVHGLNLTLQQGKVPDTLAQQQSGIIRVTV